jgi:hypothetical protein
MMKIACKFAASVSLLTVFQALLAVSLLAQSTATSTIEQQKEVSVTVYNSDLALVRDVRQVDLPSGTVNLRFMDIAANVNPVTVQIVSTTAPKELTVLEQNYEYDLLNPAKLLDKYVGKQVTLVRQRMRDNSTEEEDVKATLLANNGDGGPVWQVGNQIITGMGADRYVFPDVPSNLYTKPTLIWLLDNRHTGTQTVEASYLTSGMNWNADYVMNVTPDERRAGLNGWVSITNSSGTRFRNADLQLVAGAVHRVQPPVMFAKAATNLQGAVAGVPGGFTQENISEYHLYTLNHRTTLSDNETKQISLLEAHGVGIDKHFIVNGQLYYFQEPLAPGLPVKDPVEVHLKFKNSKANALGMPLPAGTVRVYQEDSKGRAQFIGEDHIDHTPKDEKVDLHVGDAFDVVEERKQTDYQRLGPHVFEMAFEIRLRNHKTEPITVEVNEPIPGDWTIEESNFKYVKTGAFAARFTVPVPAGGESVLKYRVRSRW